MTHHIGPSASVYFIFVVLILTMLGFATGLVVINRQNTLALAIGGISILLPLALLLATIYAMATGKTVASSEEILVKAFLTEHRIRTSDITVISTSEHELNAGLIRVFGVSLASYHAGMFRSPSNEPLVLLTNGTRTVEFSDGHKTYLVSTGDRTPEFLELIGANSAD